MNRPRRDSILETLHRHDSADMGQLAKRSLRVAWAKKLLPVVAALLLVALVIVPSLRLGPDGNRVAYQVSDGSGPAPTSKLLGATYHGTDQQGNPFTITADTAIQSQTNLVTLTNPEADISLKSGTWLMLKAQSGLYHQDTDQLELSGTVTLYRNDGTTMTTSAAALDLRDGTAQGSAPVQAQGPFGTLSAQNGFQVVDRGAGISFKGPVDLTLTQAP
ncbi:LPS export ABC transporter periplasmic protein LptC [Acidocella sp.]|uniref:LPS export ABC transporter periplasmic protein LptC n=1 Tax=Acidocella sp. TaxID=50710 RepID=UPI0026265446|nr:LPS export ABC transporter periplasmic protein LptC [Acidocella sp.]